jgi:hypothetical protein
MEKYLACRVEDGLAGVPGTGSYQKHPFKPCPFRHKDPRPGIYKDLDKMADQMHFVLDCPGVGCHHFAGPIGARMCGRVEVDEVHE